MELASWRGIQAVWTTLKAAVNANNQSGVPLQVTCDLAYTVQARKSECMACDEDAEVGGAGVFSLHRGQIVDMNDDEIVLLFKVKRQDVHNFAGPFSAKVTPTVTPLVTSQTAE